MTDKEMTLKVLKARGKLGIHSFHLNHLVGTTRTAARINDLRNDGHIIHSRPERLGTILGARYTLDFIKEKEYKWVFENGTARQVEI